MIFAANTSWLPPAYFRNSDQINSGQEIATILSLLSHLVAFDFARKHNDLFLSRFMNALTCVAVGVFVICTSLVNEFSWVAMIILLNVLTAFMLAHYARGWQARAGILLVIILALLFQHSDELLRALMATGWWGLAATGITAVVGSAVMEKSIRRRPQSA